jgi:hypothetical protein
VSRFRFSLQYPSSIEIHRNSSQYSNLADFWPTAEGYRGRFSLSASSGDFWLNNLKDGKYTLLLEKKGYMPQELGPADVTEKDANVGDINL